MAKGEIVPAAADEGADGADDDRPSKGLVPVKGSSGTVPARPSRPGFFTIYKNRQGKWTRLGTVFAAAALGLLTAYNVYQYVLPYLPVVDTQHPNNHAVLARQLLMLGCVLFLVVYGLLVFWIGNKPTNVDFLIATDSEMKKVNWTTRGELFGSTRVVVVFLVFIATFLFVVDLIFQQFFHLIRVLQ